MFAEEIWFEGCRLDHPPPVGGSKNPEGFLGEGYARETESEFVVEGGVPLPEIRFADARKFRPSHRGRVAPKIGSMIEPWPISEPGIFAAT